MAMYYFRLDSIGRSKNRSTIKNAAYICGKKLYDIRNDKVWNFEHKAHRVVFFDTVYPENSNYKDLSVWNTIEVFEDQYALDHYRTELTQEKYRSSAITATTIIMSLPNELNFEQNHEIVKQFIDQRFTSRNLISTYALHDNPNNPHAHLQITRRPTNEQGEFCLKKDQEICSRKEFHATRKLYADLVNEKLEQYGFNERISEKSHASRGIKIIPQKYLGFSRNGKLAWINQEIFHKNEQMIIGEPEVFLDYLNKTRVNVTKEEAIQKLHKYVREEEQVKYVINNIFQSEVDKTITMHNEFIAKIESLQRQDFKQLNNNYKQSYILNSVDISEETLILNTINQTGLSIFMMNSEAHKDMYGYGFLITHSMIQDYINHFHLNIPFEKQYAEFASILADNMTNNNLPLSLSDTAKCIRQVFCMETLTQANLELNNSLESSVVSSKAITLSNYINHNNIWILNDKKIMQEALLKIQPDTNSSTKIHEIYDKYNMELIPEKQKSTDFSVSLSLKFQQNIKNPFKDQKTEPSMHKSQDLRSLDLYL